MSELEPDFLDEFAYGFSRRPHEIHVTVDNSADPDHFVLACELLGVDAQVIYNERPNDEALVDLLTVSHLGHNSTSAEAVIRMGQVVDGLSDLDLTVVRQKIETSPTHPYAPKWQDRTPKPGTYFESHLVMDLPVHDLMRLGLVWEGTPLLLSTSENKRRNGQTFVTYRRDDMLAQDFYEDVDELYATLKGIARLGQKTIEFALYDSNVEHDLAWTRAYE